MSIKLIDDPVIGSFWACPIEYGDYSGLTDEEIDQLHAWLKKYEKAGKPLTFEFGEESFFDTDEITGLMADCIQANIYQEVEGDDD